MLLSPKIRLLAVPILVNDARYVVSWWISIYKCCEPVTSRTEPLPKKYLIYDDSRPGILTEAVVFSLTVISSSLVFFSTTIWRRSSTHTIWIHWVLFMEVQQHSYYLEFVSIPAAVIEGSKDDGWVPEVWNSAHNSASSVPQKQFSQVVGWDCPSQ
eukprot:Gb_24744 [translate_table: standard]